jgi:hypothetical protein
MKTSYLAQSRGFLKNLSFPAGQHSCETVRWICFFMLALSLSLSTCHCLAQSSIYYKGLLHSPLGNAMVQIDSTGNLLVSGIGSSGNDGVQIATGGSGGGTTLNLGVFNPAVVPAGASLGVAMIGRSDGMLQQINLQSTADGGAIFADCTGLGAPTVSVALYSNDTLVAVASGIPPTTALATFTTAGTPHGAGLPMILNPCILNPEACYGNVDFTLSIPDPTGPNGTIITIPGNGPMFCTRMQISPGYPVPYFVPTYQVKATTITGVDFSSLYIEHEGFFPCSLEHNVIGQAHYDFSTPGALTIDNLGPDGNDGVDVELRNANTYGLDMVALNPQPLPPGQSPTLLAMRSTGQLAGGAGEQALGTLQFLNQETNVGLSADLLPVGSASVHVELWQGCSLVSSYDVPSGGLVLTSDQGGTGVSVGYDPGDDPCGTTPPLPPWWWWIKWPGPVQLTTPTGAVMADHVRLAPETGTASLVALTDVRLQITQAGTFLHELAHNFGLSHGGSHHYPLGSATLWETNGNIEINCNGDLTGDAGVEVSLRRANFGEVPSPLLPVPPSASMLYEFHATLDNIEDRIASTLTVSGNAAGETQFAADMSPLGASQYSIWAFDGGIRIAGVSNQPAGVFSALSGTIALASLRSDILHSKSYVRIRLPKVPGDPGPVIRLSPGLEVNGDEVVVMAEDALRYVGPQNRIRITATGMDTFELRGEKLGYFGNGHTALGTAMLSTDGGVVGVGHIGTSGNNGVGIDLNNAPNALVSFAPFDFSAVQAPGSPVPWLQAGISGGFGPLLNQDLGSLRFTSVAGGGAQISADFSSIGASTHTIEVWNGGQLVQRISGHAGGVATVNDWPIGLGIQTAGSPTAASGCTAMFGQVEQIAIGGGPALQGDELPLFPENPSQPIGELQSLNLLGSGFDSFTIVGETVTPSFTPIITGLNLIQTAAPNVALSVPTLFGYDYTLQTVSDLLPHPWPWTPANAFFGDGSVQTITLPANQPQQFFRLSVQSPGM